MPEKGGRVKTVADPYAHFVDDERSTALFVGYSTAALHLQVPVACVCACARAPRALLHVHGAFKFVQAGLGAAITGGLHAQNHW